MKIIQNNLLQFAIIFTASLLLTSCGQQEVPTEVADEPLGLEIGFEPEVLTEERDAAEDFERIPSCWCRHRGVSRRTSTSSYVYCYGYTGIPKTYYLANSSGTVLQQKSTSHYNVQFSGLQTGTTYKYRTLTYCNPSKPTYSPWTTFKQKP